jgi:hypothetical protein
MPSMSEWGPPLWFSLHTIASTYPDVATEERRQGIVSMMDGLSKNMPCGICGAHLQDYLMRNPIYPHTATRDELEEFFYNLHEDVNKRNNKPRMHSLQEVRDAFSGRKSWTKFGGYPLPHHLIKDEFKMLKSESTESSSSDTEKGDWKMVVIICLIVLVVLFGSATTFLLVKQIRSNKKLLS